jgi:hypothetical protein
MKVATFERFAVIALIGRGVLDTGTGPMLVVHPLDGSKPLRKIIESFDRAPQITPDAQGNLYAVCFTARLFRVLSDFAQMMAFARSVAAEREKIQLLNSATIVPGARSPEMKSL